MSADHAPAFTAFVEMVAERALARAHAAETERDALRAQVEAALRVLYDGPDTWEGYDSRDTGEVFLRESVLDFTADLRAALDTAPAPTEPEPVIDAAHIAHQREWSTATFGPRDLRGPLGPLAHIRKELDEVAADPTDLEEWVDVLILAFDGAWRAGHEPQQIIDGIKAKQAKNEARDWPDWRGVPADQAIEHVRSTEPDADERCHNGHPFAPGVSIDHAPGESDPRWCNTCGEARTASRDADVARGKDALLEHESQKVRTSEAYWKGREEGARWALLHAADQIRRTFTDPDSARPLRPGGLATDHLNDGEWAESIVRTLATQVGGDSDGE